MVKLHREASATNRATTSKYTLCGKTLVCLSLVWEIYVKSSYYPLLARDNNDREGLLPLYCTVYSPTKKKTNISNPVSGIFTGSCEKHCLIGDNPIHKDLRPSPPPPPPSHSGDPPWILKRGGLESSGQELISSIGKTKIIVCHLVK